MRAGAPRSLGAAALVMLPAELLTTTVNSDPLFEVVVAGVVYKLAVALPIAVPLSLSAG